MQRLPGCLTALSLSLIATAVPATAHQASAQKAEPIKFGRFPHISNDGTIAFTYQDDIWLADADGGNARRLTIHPARDFSPRFSPDGK